MNNKVWNSLLSLKKKGYLFFCILTACLFSNTLSAQEYSEDDYIQEIIAQFNKENWKEGKGIIDKVIKEYPKDSDLRMLNGKYYLHIQDYDKARYELNKALQENPNNEEAKKILINVETQTERYSSAICYVNELLELSPYSQDLWRKKIDLYSLQGNEVEANRLLKRFQQIYPEDAKVQKYYLEKKKTDAITKQKEGDLEEAIELNKELVNRQSKNVDYYLDLVNNYIKAGDRYNALAYINRGLLNVPGNQTMINKKASLLADDKKYEELLTFLKEEMKKNNSNETKNLYNYYLLESARNAKDKDSYTLYGKVLENNPGNEEAFSYVFNQTLSNQQYEYALYILNKYRQVRGETKDILLNELSVYKKMGNLSQEAKITKLLFEKYPEDTNIRYEYLQVLHDEAKANVQEQDYIKGLDNWNNILKNSNSEEMDAIAQNGIYSSYVALGDYDNALVILNELIQSDSKNPVLYMKRADLYFKQKKYFNAVSDYEKSLELVDNKDVKKYYLGGYGDMLTQIVKDLNSQFLYKEAKDYTARWLRTDSDNLLALHYMINLLYATNQKEEALDYVKKANKLYPDEVFFKIKLADFSNENPDNFVETYNRLRNELKQNPYHQDLINAFVGTTEKYSQQLMKDRELERSMIVLDSALYYDSENKNLKYMKGLVYEKLHKFDSAYYYQSFYEPSLMELSGFKQRLSYLNYKKSKNQIGIDYISSRLGDSYNTSTVSKIEYSRIEEKNTYTGRINYAGRKSGKGLQFQAEWGHIWTPALRTRMDIAWANQFFPKIIVNASVYKTFLSDWEAELGIGYRLLPENEENTIDPEKIGDNLEYHWWAGNENLMNVVLGATKEIYPWSLNVRLNNFLLQGTKVEGNYNSLQNEKRISDTEWLYNFSGQARYFLSSPKHYLLATASIGNSPDIELINYQFYSGFSVLNTMVGGGGGYLISDTVSASVIGTWYNYLAGKDKFQNIYNFQLNINVVF